MNSMKGSYRLGTAFGIGIFVHWTFALLIGWIFFAYLSAGAGFAKALEGIALVMLVFGCVTLHELGHSLTARLFGIQTQHITLLPIGGVAALERMPRNPKQELWIAIAGPAVNVVIIGVLVVLSMILGFGAKLTGLTFVPQAGLISNLIMINAVLILFNMIPAFPMDGGRVLRALLSMKKGHLAATLIAARIGKVLAIVLGVAGVFLLHNPFLIITALFVHFGAESERLAAVAEAQMDARRGYTVIDVDPVYVRGR